MVIVNHCLPADYQIIFSGDWHEGTVLQEPKVLHKVRDEVLNVKNTYLIHPGDWCEAITIDDPRYSRLTDRGLDPIDQYKAVRDFIRPIRKNILAALFGNHDWKLFKTGNFVQRVVCGAEDETQPVKIPYGTYTAKVIIRSKVVKEPLKIYVTHGRKSIGSVADDPVRRKSNMELVLKRHLQNQAGDCLIMVKGHAHKLLAVSPSEELYLYDDGAGIKSAYTGAGAGNYIDPNLRFYGCSGSALRLFADPSLGVSGYGELAEYSPVELGYLRATIRGGKVVKWEKVVVG